MAALRQVAPTGPALHLGADRILVIGVARTTVHPDASSSPAPPSMAQIGGQVLASIFTDALGTDLERVRLVNTAVRQIPLDRLVGEPDTAARRRVSRSVTPSVALEEYRACATRPSCRGRSGRCCAAVGGMHRGGAGLLSYLLFAPGFCKALLELGRTDAQAKRAEIESVLIGAPFAVLDSIRVLSLRPGSRRTSPRGPDRSAPGS